MRHPAGRRRGTVRLMEPSSEPEPSSASSPAEPIVPGAAGPVGELVSQWLVPCSGECLACFLERAVTAFGCQGDLRLAARYRDLAAPRSTALESRLSAAGGYCDCEVLMNVFEPAPHLWTSGEERDPADDEFDDELDDAEPEPPEVMPRCAGVRRGTVQPCGNWHTVGSPRRVP